MATAVALLFVPSDALAAQSPSPTPLTLLARDGRRALALTLVNDQEFVALDELAAIFQLAVREEARGALTVSYRGRTIVLTRDQALASVAGRLVSLPAPPARAEGRWLVPVEFIGSALVLVYDARLDLRKASHLLVVGDLRVPRITVRYDTAPGGGRLTIDATPRATSAVTGEGNERLIIRFDADAIDFSAPPASSQASQGFVDNVRATDGTTLTVDLGSRVAGYRTATEQLDASARLTIDLRAAQPEAAPAAAPAAAATPLPLAAPAPPTLPVRTLATIVIDPGHGGEDRGVEGAGGAREKDLALAAALALRSAIEGRLGVRVLLTREDDRQMSLDDRSSFANTNNGDLFISLHANASLHAAAAGASIYSAAFDPDRATAAAARAERVPVVGGGVRDIELTAWNRVQTRHLDRSLAFAALLAEQLRNRVPLLPRAVGRAPLGVLESANMPAVLIEMGFLSNPDQEKLMGESDFQNAFVQAVTNAVVLFRDLGAAGGTR